MHLQEFSDPYNNYNFSAYDMGWSPTLNTNTKKICTEDPTNTEEKLCEPEGAKFLKFDTMEKKREIPKLIKSQFIELKKTQQQQKAIEKNKNLLLLVEKLGSQDIEKYIKNLEKKINRLNKFHNELGYINYYSNVFSNSGTKDYNTRFGAIKYYFIKKTNEREEK